MAQKPIYDQDGNYVGLISDGLKAFPPVEENRDGQEFLATLTGQSKTLQSFLDDNPYVAPAKTADQLADEKEQGDIKALDAATVQDSTLKLLLQREQRRLGK